MALNINGTTGISGVDGSVSAPAVTGTDSNTGITFPSADTIKFSTGGVERMQITNSGVTGTGIGAGKILQVVQATTSGTNNYASVDFQNTVVTVNITPVSSNSKFLIDAFIQFGIASHDCATSFNFSDSLHASGTTHPIAPMGDSGNGATGSNLGAYFGIGSFYSLTAMDNYFIGNVSGKFLYTPASDNANQRAFTVMVRSQEGRNIRFNMNAHYNAADPKDMRTASAITVMEVGV
nr:endo-N-actetylneuraminidase [uncultured Mediterranean phage uvMED]